MLAESTTAILARNEDWTGTAATEPYEAGWAREAVIFVRALKEPTGPQPRAIVEMSPDGMHWLPEGTALALPETEGGIAMARISHFGNWLRLRADFATGSGATVLVTLHLKS
ncbi:hypothetical protein GE300_07125 [Rhodobacteraceae bacterium 2CG4]|uniref:Uncharacterized protein n=1 Tax=Halovulum marinum TaxID=2662447 RepID=A0A6L5YZS9_9RHOB|nr:hypothetical protein [Halovulum marinum]MSU89390.1 hypothetical protein [Halovulum marinum]